MKKKYYYIYKSLGICTSCRKNKAEPNRTTCLACSFDHQGKKKNYDKVRKSEYNKRKRDLCKAFGVCTTCMKRDSVKGQQCLDCYVKRMRKYKEKQLEKGKIPRNLFSEMNLCTICGGPVVEGKKLCEKHLNVARTNIAIARKHINLESHTWKEQKNLEIIMLEEKYKSKSN